MQFRVVPAVGADPTDPTPVPPAARHHPAPAATVTRPLALLEEMSAFFDDAPAEALLGHRRRRPEHRPAGGAEAVDGPGHREPGGRRHRGVGALQRHRRRPPDAHPRGGLRGGEPPGHPVSTRKARCRSSRIGPSRRPSRGRPGSRTPSSPTPARSPGCAAVRQRPASSCGTATSSSTRTTR